MDTQNNMDETDVEPAPAPNGKAGLIGICCALGGMVLIAIVLFTVPETTAKVTLVGVIFMGVPVFYLQIITHLASQEAARSARAAVRSSKRNTRQIESVNKGLSEVHAMVNGITTERVKSAGLVEHAAGLAEGLQEGRAHAEEHAAEVAAALATVPAAAAVAPVVVIAPVANGVAPSAAPTSGGKDTVTVTGEDLHTTGPSKPKATP